MARKKTERTEQVEGQMIMPTTEEMETIDNFVEAESSKLSLFPVKSKDDERAASDHIAHAKQVIDRLEVKRKFFVSGPTKFVDMLNSYFNPKIKLIKAAIDQLKQTMSTFHMAEQRAIDEARRREAEKFAAKAERAEEKGQPAPVFIPTTAIAPAVIKTETSAASYVDCWQGTLEDANLVPDEYWIIDDAKVQRIIKASKGSIPIPGYKIFNIPRPAIR